MNIRFYHAKILLTKADHTFEVAEGELWVRGDHICYIGDGTDTSAVCKEDDIIIWDREIDAKGNLLMPGFKNAHTHTPMTFLRSFADDLPLQEWLQQKVFPNEARLKGEDTYWLAILGIMEYLTSGITSNFDMYIMQDYHINAYVDTGFRTVFTSGLNNFTDSLEVLEENYLRINGLSDLTSYVPGFHAEYTTSRPLLEGVAKIADKYHAPVWTHNSETEREVAECKARWGMTPMQFTESLGLYEHGGGGYHCVWLEEKDIEILKKHHMSVVTNPGSNTKLASGIMQTGSLLIVLLGLSTLTTGILQGLGRMKEPLIHSAIALVLHLIVLAVLMTVFKLNIYGVLYSNIFFGLIMCILNAISIKKYLRYRQELVRTFIIPLVSSGIMGLAAYGIYTLFHLAAGNAVSCLAAILAAVIVYGVVLIKLRGITERELYAIPKGAVLVGVLKKCRLL